MAAGGTAGLICLLHGVQVKTCALSCVMAEEAVSEVCCCPPWPRESSWPSCVAPDLWPSLGLRCVYAIPFVLLKVASQYPGDNFFEAS